MALVLQKHSPTAGFAKGGGKILRVFILIPSQERNTRAVGISMVHPKSDGLPKSLAGLPEKTKQNHSVLRLLNPKSVTSLSFIDFPV